MRTWVKDDFAQLQLDYSVNDGKYTIIDASTGDPVNINKMPAKGSMYKDARVIQQAVSELVELATMAYYGEINCEEFVTRYRNMYVCLERNTRKMLINKRRQPYFDGYHDYYETANRVDMGGKFSLDVIIPLLNIVNDHCLTRRTASWSCFSHNHIDVMTLERTIMKYLAPYALHINGINCNIKARYLPAYWLFTAGGVVEPFDDPSYPEIKALILMPAYINFIFNRWPILNTREWIKPKNRSSRIIDIDGNDLTNAPIDQHTRIYREGCVHYGVPITRDGTIAKKWFSGRE